MDPGTGGGMLAAPAPSTSTLPRKKINVGKIPDSARAEVPPKPKSADVARARILRPDYYG
jgi:hypothetical protein